MARRRLWPLSLTSSFSVFSVLPNINLAMNEASVRPQTLARAGHYEHIEVSVVTLVQQSDYKLLPSTLKSRDHKRTRYDHKLTKHGLGDCPMIFDFASS